MTVELDDGAVQRAAAGVALRLPRVSHRGKLGEVRSASTGNSMELHDFRSYHPGDDLRHLDWNAVARTGELILRVRQDEVSPRVEVLLDASASMAVSPEKSARARELTWWTCLLARHGGLDPVLLSVGVDGRRVDGASVRAFLGQQPFDGREPFDVAMKRLPPLLPCGLRIVLSDFLFEANPQTVVDRLARGAAGLALVQVVDPEDLEPTGGAGARLIDSESTEALDRILTSDVVDRYRARLKAQVELWQAAAQRCRATWVQASAAFTVDQLVRSALAPLVELA